MKENKGFFEKLKSLVDTKLSEFDSEVSKEIEKIEEVKKVELAQMKLEDGAVLEAESFEAGQSVFIVNEDERIPLPVGSYVLDDGMELVVEEEGLIASIGEPAPVEEEMKQEFVTVEQFNSAIEEIKGMFSKEETLKEEVSELSKQNEELNKELETKKTELSEAAVEPLKKAPSEVETKLAKTKKGRIAQAIQNAKN